MTVTATKTRTKNSFNSSPIFNQLYSTKVLSPWPYFANVSVLIESFIDKLFLFVGNTVFSKRLVQRTGIKPLIEQVCKECITRIDSL